MRKSVGVKKGVASILKRGYSVTDLIIDERQEEIEPSIA
jgi:hypothetical protein